MLEADNTACQDKPAAWPVAVEGRNLLRDRCVTRKESVRTPDFGIFSHATCEQLNSFCRVAFCESLEVQLICRKERRNVHCAGSFFRMTMRLRLQVTDAPSCAGGRASGASASVDLT